MSHSPPPIEAQPINRPGPSSAHQFRAGKRAASGSAPTPHGGMPATDSGAAGTGGSLSRVGPAVWVISEVKRAGGTWGTSAYGDRVARRAGGTLHSQRR